MEQMCLKAELWTHQNWVANQNFCLHPQLERQDTIAWKKIKHLNI